MELHHKQAWHDILVPKYRNYRRLDGKIQDTTLKNTGDLKGGFNDKYNSPDHYISNYDHNSWTVRTMPTGRELRGHLGVPDSVSEPLIVPLNYLVILHLIS